MYKINWNRFEIKNRDKENEFEKMCRHLFLRKFKKTGYDFVSNHNQTGLETEPVEYLGKYYGFQCKYVTSGNASGLYKQVWKSLKKAFDLFEGKLDVVYIYTNANIRPTVSAGELSDTKIKSDRVVMQRSANKKGITLEWITTDRLDEILNEVKNYDIYRLFFSEQNEVKYIDSNISMEERTFLESDEYISLNVNGDSFRAFEDHIRKNSCSMLVGDAGSGKTEMLKKLYINHSALFLDRFNKVDNGVEDIPVFVKLRECVNGNLESLIRERLRDYNISLGSNQQFSYYLDGLDEIGLDDINNTIDAILRLINDSNVRTVVVSSRLLSPNLSFFYRDVEPRKYRIDKLNEDLINKFFSMKTDKYRLKVLDELNRNNSELLSEFEDILSLNLFWQEIDRFEIEMTKIDIIELSIDGRISRSKKIDKSNLPNYKRVSITEILKDVTLLMQKNRELYVSLSVLQHTIENRFPKLSYSDVDSAVSLLAELFFDEVGYEEQKEHLFSFKHRRLQEYFLYKKISQQFYENPFVLRTLGLLSNKDFMLNIFLTQELKESNNKQDLLKYSTLRFLEAYLGDEYVIGFENKWIGRRGRFGVGGEAYLEMDTFLDVMASKSQEDLIRWLEDRSVNVSGFLSTKNYWNFVRLYYKMNGIDIRSLLNNYYDIDDDFLKEAVRKDIKPVMFYSCVIAGNNYKKIYEEKILSTVLTEEVLEFDFYSVNNNRPTSKYGDFYRIGLDYYIVELIEIVDGMNHIELEILSYILLQPEQVKVLYSNVLYYDFRDHFRIRINELKSDELGVNTIVVKWIITGVIDDLTLIRNRFNEHNIDHFSTWGRNFSLNSYCGLILNKENNVRKEYALGVELRKILQNITNLKKEVFLQQIIENVRKYNIIYNNWFKYYNSRMIGEMLAGLSFSEDGIKRFFSDLAKYPSVISITVVLYRIFLINRERFRLVTNLSMLELIRKNDSSDISYYDYNAENEFMYVAMIGEFSTRKADTLLIDAINSSLFRPAFRHEDLVSVILPICVYQAGISGAIEISVIENYIERIYKMLGILAKTTDQGDGYEHIKATIKALYPDFSQLEELYDVEDIDIMKNKSSSSIDVREIDYKNIADYYKCDVEGIDYSKMEVWAELIKIEESEDSELNILYGMLDRNYFPDPYASNISKYFYIITATLLSKKDQKRKITNLLFEKYSRYSIVNQLKLYISLGDSTLVYKYTERLMELTEALVYVDCRERNININDSFDKVKLMRIIADSNASDWIQNSDFHEYIYRDNTDIRILEESTDREEKVLFEWATRHSDENAYKVEYVIKYKQIAFEWFSLVFVDGYRALLPFPKANTKYVPRIKYKLASIIGDERSLNEYLRLSGLIIE